MTFFELFFLLVFICLCYFLNCRPTNKRALVLHEHQAQLARELAARERERQRPLLTTLFLAQDDYVTDTVFVTASADARTVTVERRGQRYVYHTDQERERRMLLPLLLLSK
ncbi:entry/fusion complex component [Equine molluscum contagiosum-like virus]|nr:entry/fusion complex component [Equine molluscum contagiosum-like virus]